jgi:hypothetical protein
MPPYLLIFKACLSFWFDTTYDSVSFFKRSGFKGKRKKPRTLAPQLMIVLLMFQMRAFLFLKLQLGPNSFTLCVIKEGFLLEKIYTGNKLKIFCVIFIYTNRVVVPNTSKIFNFRFLFGPFDWCILFINLVVLVRYNTKSFDKTEFFDKINKKCASILKSAAVGC